MSARHGERWTPREDRRLRLLWGVSTLDVIARDMRRTPIATHARARQLGLQCGAPEGGEYVWRAARRCGYELHTFWRILRWARSYGVEAPTLRTLSRPDSKGGHAHHWIDPTDADAAVELWVRSETPTEAARRHETDPCAVRRWLRAAGHTPPKRGREWHVLPEEVDAAEKAWRTGETATEAARRLGLDRHTVTKWLRAAGVEPRGRLWRVERAVVDRVVSERAGRRAA